VGKEGRRKERGKGREWGGNEREWKGIGRVGLKPSQSQISGYATDSATSELALPPTWIRGPQMKNSA